MRKKEKHTSDWTTVLQERLRDASLPLEDGWEQAGIPGRSGLAPRFSGPRAPWGWVLAGAAAVLAAVLVLRPAAPSGLRPAAPAGEEPVRLVEAPAAGLGGAAGDQGLGVARNSAVAQVRTRHTGPAPATDRTRIADVVPEPVSASQQPESGKGADTRKEAGDVRMETAPAGGKEPAAPAESGSGGSWPEAWDPARDRDRTAVRRRPVSLRLQAAGPGVSFAAGGSSSTGAVSMAEPGGNYGAESGLSYEQQVRRAPVFPLSVGISAAVPLSRRWTLAAGLEYAQRAGAVIPSAAGSTPSQELTLHYLGIPLDLHCYLNPDDRLRVWLGGGLKAEKAIHVTGAAALRDPVLCSWNLQAGADLRVLPGVRLYLSPALTNYLNRSAYSAAWDDGPTMTLRAGLSFDLK